MKIKDLAEVLRVYDEDVEVRIAICSGCDEDKSNKVRAINGLSINFDADGIVESIYMRCEQYE